MRALFRTAQGRRVHGDLETPARRATTFDERCIGLADLDEEGGKELCHDDRSLAFVRTSPLC
jgi:hypothetical protein